MFAQTEPSDALQLVDLGHRLALVGHGHAAQDLERIGVAEGQLGAAVAHHQARAVVAEAPALAAVAEAAQLLEGVGVPHEGGAFLPGELDDAVADDGDALVVLAGRWRDAAQHRTGQRVDLAQLRLAGDALALEEAALRVEGKALGPRGAVVRADRHDLVAEDVDGRIRGARRRGWARRRGRARRSAWGFARPPGCGCGRRTTQRHRREQGQGKTVAHAGSVPVDSGHAADRHRH